MALNGIRAAFFDLDGTLIDSAPDIASALNSVLASEKLSRQPTDLVLRWIGRGPEKLVERALSHADGAVPDVARVVDVTGRYLDAYHANVCRLTRLYDHVHDVLGALSERGIAMACVTNKVERLTRPVLEELDLARYFPVALCADSMEQRKPSPEPLLRAAELLEQSIDTCVMVGDSINDIASGRAAGCRVVAVSWGYNHGEDIRDAGADVVIDSLPELLQLIH